MHKRTATLSFLVGIWFVLASVIIFWLSSANKSYFDPKLNLSQALMSLTFEDNLQQALDPLYSPALASQGAIFHVVQGDCYCERLARPHQQKIDIWAQQNAFDTYTLNLKESPSLSDFVPSTPAVIALDYLGKIIYFGPYSRGSGCFAQSGDIDARLAQWIGFNEQQKVEQTMLVDTDASGCYCEN